jgi:hypothetical protein
VVLGRLQNRQFQLWPGALELGGGSDASGAASDDQDLVMGQGE